MQEFDEFLDPDLNLPVRGQPVRIASPTAWEGLRLRKLFADLDALTPEIERAEVRRLLGGAWDQLDQLGADATVIALAGRTALLHFGKGSDAAATFWNGEIHADSADETDTSAPGYLGPDDPGGGPIDPVTGLRHWFNPPEMAPANTAALTLSWREILSRWRELELDLHTVFGVDVNSGVLHERPWRWLEVRIRDIANTPGTRLHRAIFPPTQ
ncbi:DUF7426 family protein [Nocardia terpenica]|uniref:DUF7426 domain-containing protein n=1 Tax=Nocardia terpenica TaxID=455432 RepID=A0A6G9YZ58_9NOCA|nr:hypothetical protein [Nocardia terpenica]QIS18528.1 hypothetical protein F6W96_09745 [Nocardia terpenica]